MMVAIYGAPGTGKTTLLEEIERRNDEEDCPYYFQTIDEPTSRADIAERLRLMYAETANDVESGSSVTAEVQTLIMQTRISQYDCFMEHSLRFALREANARKKTLVVVCDGHVLTDDKLYVRSKHDAGQISTQQFAQFTACKERALADAAEFFAAPAAYFQLTIDNDPTGTKHHHRVCVQRANATESNVDPAVFARLAQYADSTFELLQQTASTNNCTVAKIPTDQCTPTEVYAEFLRLIADKIKREKPRYTFRFKNEADLSDTMVWYTHSKKLILQTYEYQQDTFTGNVVQQAQRTVVE